MNIKTFLRNAWNEPHRFFFWLTMLSLVGFGVECFIVKESFADTFLPPRWIQAMGLLFLVGCILGFIIGLLGFIFSWIPPLYRLEAKLLRRRFFVFACLVTFIALVNTEENWRGRKAYENYKREWEAKGERFDLASFIPPTVPDEQNFAMTPLFHPLYDYTRGTNSGSLWNDTNGFNHLGTIRADLSSGKKDRNTLTLGNLDKGTVANLELCRDFYRGNTNYPQPIISGTAAEDILFALGKFDVEMKELSEAAKNRTSSRFPIHYNEQPVAGILLPHLANMKGLCALFQMRATARLEVGQAEAALEDLKVGFRLADSIHDEPFIISHLIRLAMTFINLQTVHEGLVRHAWNDAQLVEIEKYLGSVDLLSELKKSMRSERALNLEDIDYIRRQMPLDVARYMDNHSGDPSQGSAISFMPSGWIYQNMLLIAQMHQQFTIAVVDDKQHRVFPEVAVAADKATYALSREFSPYSIFARMLFPALTGAGKRSGRIQTFIDATRVACTLERFRLVNGKLPEKLDPLVPGFIDKIPSDVIDGQPLRYRLNSDGSYILYSIGWNQKDEGGQIVWTMGKTPSVDQGQGDWVWQSQAK